MATQVEELYLKNKNRSKRDFSSAGFSLQVKLPGGGGLTNGSHILGHIEPNIAVVRYGLVVREGFGGSATISIADNLGNDIFVDQDISAEGYWESALTENAAVRPDPIYSDKLYEVNCDLSGAANVGELILIIDYVQLDTVTGTHTK